jgi:phosphoribosylanthranilate isomerase
MLVQIFEVQTAGEAAALVRLGVDHIGVLVGDGAFPRELSIAQTKAIFAAVPAGHRRVALSLSVDLEQVIRVVERTQPDIVQMQAEIDEFSVAMTRDLKARFPDTMVIRAIPVIDERSIGTAATYRGVADFLLLDTYDSGSRQFGALGRIHDWNLSRRIVDEVGIPIILAGGLDPDNVAMAITAVQPVGVDSKTRTDRPDGRGKDLAKVKAFVAAAKPTK